jgi:hypothetical protein
MSLDYQGKVGPQLERLAVIAPLSKQIRYNDGELGASGNRDIIRSETCAAYETGHHTGAGHFFGEAEGRSQLSPRGRFGKAIKEIGERIRL